MAAKRARDPQEQSRLRALCSSMSAQQYTQPMHQGQTCTAGREDARMAANARIARVRSSRMRHPTLARRAKGLALGLGRSEEFSK